MRVSAQEDIMGRKRKREKSDKGRQRTLQRPKNTQHY